MDLALPTEGLEKYKSSSQRARIFSEAWGAKNLYCPCCDSDSVSQLAANSPTVDFRCPACSARFQLKCSAKPFSGRLLDGAYSKMYYAVLHSETPHFFLMSYELESLRVQSLVCIPDFALTESALERRNPLRSTARRAGYIGCYILLHRIPPDARIDLVRDSIATSATDVRRAYRKLKPLATLTVEKRGWTLDVLNVVRSLKKDAFTLPEVYAFVPHLSALHPNNRHVRDKVRQQLQILRDLGLVTFLGDGSYRLT